MEPDRNDVIESSERRPDRCFAVAMDIPCKSDTRRKVFPLVVHDRAPRISGVTREGYARRRILVLLGLDALSERVQIEIVRAAIGPCLREERLPAKPGVNCQFARRLPRVGNIGSEIPFIARVDFKRRLRECEDIPAEKVGITEPGDLSIEGGNAAAI